MTGRGKSLDNGNTKISMSQEQKKLFRWNKKQFFYDYLKAVIW